MTPLDLVLVSVLDLIFGDPEWFPHPIRGIGRLISLLEKIFKGNSSKWIERIKGTAVVLVTIGVTLIIGYLFINLSQGWRYLAWIYLGYICISIRDLQIKAKDIYKELKKWDIKRARQKLSKIVGRDTQELSKEKIITATVESIAESTNDGIIAPLFYLVIGGPLLGITYKAISTLDSMLGYKSEKYLHFGWFSARLDTIVNYVPARICGILISVGSLITGKNFRDSLKILIRDGRNHSSPNSGISEAAMAGALGIKLGGPSYYQGELVEKPYIGADRRQVDNNLINEARTISLVSSFLGIVLGVIFRWII